MLYKILITVRPNELPAVLGAILSVTENFDLFQSTSAHPEEYKHHTSYIPYGKGRQVANTFINKLESKYFRRRELEGALSNEGMSGSSSSQLLNQLIRAGKINRTPTPGIYEVMKESN